MLYKKQFEMNSRGGIFLRNPQSVAAYVDENIVLLLKTKDDHIAQRDVKCKIFSDFKEIYDYDIDNAFFPEPFGTFASEEAKQEFIKLKLLYVDLQLYLGDIFVSYHHELTKNNYIPMIDASTLVIDYNELLDTALVEYIRVLRGIPYPVQVRTKDIKEPEFSMLDYDRVKKKVELLDDGESIKITFCAGNDNRVIETLKIPEEFEKVS